ncbi:NUDIX domain-containing protein [Pedobacter puniceum]|jgi:8-oxo-dGTP pyrophosphatase MutT (NUDIX family)|uniref:GDP-mannose pyrophosphatase n=1 Tax=Pedobacter puniceum TaxID=2666136 RepID=A0A7K0FND4_9SPHI|nr:NUDIX hydrolase [Pedobacter puniceum]MRX47499.1 NUDIX domain-containing protein [Pedobacter puniceum]
MEENPWQILESNAIYDNPWIKITEHQVINPTGGKGIYGEVHFKNYAIGIIALDEDDKIWLVGQYRFPLKAYSWEIPEGGGPLDANPLASAKRELLEETGLVAQYWEELLRMHLSNSVSDELAIIYLARDFEQFEAQPEETEELVVKKVHFEEAYQMVLRGEITDSMSVAAILRLKLIKANL